jgi:UDP-3-O-[3-hydroxymyristoyl] N-acetylglucosamine deacetylase
VETPGGIAAGAGFGPGAGFPGMQTTLRAPIDCVGHGVHSGRRVRLWLRPAAVDTGIVFRRIDIAAADVPARFDHVVDTRLCTVLGDGDVRIGTVEHLMAALAGAGLDNVLVELDGPEVPVFDGSAEPFLFLIDCAGVQTQTAPRRMIQILRPVRVEEGDAFVELRPTARTRDGGTRAGGVRTGLDMALAIDFAAAAIGRQALSLTLNEASFRGELARARTFGLAADVAQLQASGLALGGSLDNAIVVADSKILNPGGLRMKDEFVRHKLLDAVGDLALAGGVLCGRYVGHRAGHRLNNAVLRALFADPANWRPGPAWALRPQTVAA